MDIRDFAIHVDAWDMIMSSVNFYGEGSVWGGRRRRIVGGGRVGRRKKEGIRRRAALL